MKAISDNIKALLSIIVTVMGISYFYMCSIRNIKPDPQILIAIVGSLGTVLGYFFGSSQGSAKKDDTISEVLTTPTAATNTGDINVK
jgi:hypothetical protein